MRHLEKLVGESPHQYKAWLLYLLRSSRQSVKTAAESLRGDTEIPEFWKGVIRDGQAEIHQVVHALAAYKKTDEWKARDKSLDEPEVPRPKDAGKVSPEWKRGITLKVVEYPPGINDPDEWIQKKGSASWKKAVENATPIMEWAIKKALANETKPYDLGAINRITESVFNLLCHRPIHEQEYYIYSLSADIGISPKALSARMWEVVLAKYGKQVHVRKVSL